MTPGGKSTKVECMIKTINNNGTADMCSLSPSLLYSSSSSSSSPLLITPYHPIRVEGKWRFPIEFQTPKRVTCQAVYSVVLQTCHVMFVNGFQCVGLGHDLEGDDVIQHAYFGSKRVVEDLKKCRGWERGMVEFGEGCLVRDRRTGLVCGFKNEIWNMVAA